MRIVIAPDADALKLPLGEAVTACYGLTGDGKTAIIEMAAASGLARLSPSAQPPAIVPQY